MITILFDAVGLLKKKTDESDKYYIYSIGNSNFSEDETTDHIFKSSKEMAQLALSMDQNSPENILQLENAYFDATHTRVYGFKTFGLWLQHPAMKMMVRLASMEIHSENHVHIAAFFRLFNKMLSEVKGEENYKFQPRYFVCDEGGANYKAIREVYGDEFCKNRVKGCQWHFKSNARRHAQKVSANSREEFLKLCWDLCEAETVDGFNKTMAEVKRFAEEFPELEGFVMYWDLRKSHVFPPFRGGGIPGVNMSEPGNKAMKPANTMRLVTAAIYDVAHMVYQERQLDLFQRNLLHCSGRGLTKEARDAKDRAQQMRRAQEFADIFDDEEAVLLEAEQAMNPNYYLPHEKSKHRAPKEKKGGKIQQQKGGKSAKGTGVREK